MQTNAIPGFVKPKPVITERDITFNCPSCEGELVVDSDGIGMECLCAHCGLPLVIPGQSTVRHQEPVLVPVPVSVLPAVPAISVAAGVPRAVPSAAETRPERQFNFNDMSTEQVTRRLEDLKHQLKENMSQDTEMRGHVNRATIELHRLQLRHKKLQERQADIEAEMVAAKSWIASSPA